MAKRPSSSKPGVPRDLLARAFLDILVREAGGSSKPLLRSGDPDDPIERLLEDLAATDNNALRISIRPDLAAAAVMTARAIEREPDLVRDLRRGSPVVSISTYMPDVVELVCEVVKACAFGQDTNIQVGRFDVGRSERSALLIVRDGTQNDHKADKGNDLIAAAIHAHAPIVGIAPDPRRHLPRDLMRAAQYHITIGQMDADALALIIEAVTGAAPKDTIDPELVRAVDVSDLQLSLRSDRKPEACLRRLAEIVKNRGLFDNEGPRLEELAGYGEAKQWGLELAADIAAYRKGQIEWANCEKGLLLSGPTGVGKTQYAKALAKTSGVPIIATSVAEWNAASYLSGTLQAMRNAFAQARRLAPAILFIDELDGVSDRATLRGEYVQYWSQIVNLLLELLAGVEDRPGVVVVGATNHPDKIDAAVKRAGRLDRTITIEKPGFEDLVAIFAFHLKGALANANLTPVALAARGGTGADVEAWTRRAKSKARRARRELTLQDLLDEVRGSRDPMSAALRRGSAIHEAGHVVAGVALGCFELKAVSIFDARGQTTIKLKLESGQTRRGLESFIMMLLAGRAAEELVFGADEVSPGAGGSENSDLARATRLAIDMEIRLGLGDLGIVYVPEHASELILHDAEVFAIVKRRLDRCLDEARRILAENKEALLTVADELDARGYLDRAEIDAVLAHHPLCARISPIASKSELMISDG